MPPEIAIILGWCGATLVVCITALSVALTWKAIQAMFWE